MSEAQSHDYGDDDIDTPMTLNDWLEIIDSDVDEAAADLENQIQIDKLVAFLRRKIEEIAGMELPEDFGDNTDDAAECEMIERDEEESE
jgi:hypothetical protein